MNILLVVATELEIKPLTSFFHFKEESASFKTEGLVVDVLITGVGMVATAFKMAQKLAEKKYDFAINAGIAGSFIPHLKFGNLVLIKEDTFAELGAEDDGQFLTIEDLGFGRSTYYPLAPKPEVGIKDTFTQLPLVKGITVNTVHGNFKNIQKVIKRWHPAIETMEGAAFFYACQQSQTPCVQIRAISNFIEKRNTQNWNVGLAVKNLNNWLIDYFKSYKKV